MIDLNIGEFYFQYYWFAISVQFFHITTSHAFFRLIHNINLIVMIYMIVLRVLFFFRVARLRSCSTQAVYHRPNNVYGICIVNYNNIIYFKGVARMKVGRNDIPLNEIRTRDENGLCIFT